MDLREIYARVDALEDSIEDEDVALAALDVCKAIAEWVKQHPEFKLDPGISSALGGLTNIGDPDNEKWGDPEEFDEVMGCLYDFGDDNNIWIRTFE